MHYASVICTGVPVWYLTSLTRVILDYNLIRQTSGRLAYLDLCNAFDRVKDGYLFGMLEAFRLPASTILALFAKKGRIRSPWLVLTYCLYPLSTVYVSVSPCRRCSSINDLSHFSWPTIVPPSCGDYTLTTGRRLLLSSPSASMKSILSSPWETSLRLVVLLTLCKMDSVQRLWKLTYGFWESRNGRSLPTLHDLLGLRCTAYPDATKGKCCKLTVLVCGTISTRSKPYAGCFGRCCKDKTISGPANSATGIIVEHAAKTTLELCSSASAVGYYWVPIQEGISCISYSG